MCSFIKEQGKNDYVLFMSENVFNQEFAFMKPLHENGISATISAEPEYNNQKCVAIISHAGVTFYVVDPVTLGKSER